MSIQKCPEVIQNASGQKLLYEYRAKVREVSLSMVTAVAVAAAVAASAAASVTAAAAAGLYRMLGDVAADENVALLVEVGLFP